MHRTCPSLYNPTPIYIKAIPSPILATATLSSYLPGTLQPQPSSPIVPPETSSTMHHDLLPIASSSQSTIHDSWSPRNLPLYRTSDLRSSPPRRTRTAILVPSHLPQSIVSSSTSLSPVRPVAKASIPLRREIEPGVWTDGTDRVLSAAYPAVQDFLATARKTLCLPVPPSELVFVLAALEVFYQWNDPVHWMFWNDEKKVATAAIVNRIALRTPQVIRSKVAWNGEAEYLFILSSLHGASSLPVDKDWFQILNPKAQSASMNLRKRKAQQTEQIEIPGEEEGSEIEGARPKRPKTRSARAAKPENPVTPEDTKPTTLDSSRRGESPTSFNICTFHQDGNSTVHAASACQGNKGDQASPTSDPLSLPRAGSRSLAPAAAGLHSPTPSHTHNRNRSISQTSSQTTLVAEERRSVSVLSSITVVDAHPGKGTENTIKDDQHGSGSEEEKEGMVTRGRANRARTQGISRTIKPRAKRRTVKS